MPQLSGGCHCGAVRYQFDAALDDCAHCHCSDCRKTTGGIVTTWLTIPQAAFTWLSAEPQQYQSSATCKRWFCATCGCQLALWTSKTPDSLDITVASLDQPEAAPAHRHIWDQSHLSWLYLDPQLPADDREAGVD